MSLRLLPALLHRDLATTRQRQPPRYYGYRVVEPGEFRTDFSGRSLQQSRTAITDYAETAGRRRIENDITDGHQIGDPVRGAKLIIKAVKASKLLGSDAVQVVSGALDATRTEVEAWHYRRFPGLSRCCAVSK